jgi:hypothetical protein
MPGGASFGILSVGTDLEMSDVRVVSKNGGDGGVGGQGGAGGSGGSGGQSVGNTERSGHLGGEGGAGGDGGQGGKGGAGLGGVSIGIVCSGSTNLERTNVQIETGNGGMSGGGQMRAVSEEMRGCN